MHEFERRLKQSLELLDLSGIDFVFRLSSPTAHNEGTDKHNLNHVNVHEGPRQALIELRSEVLKCTRCQELCDSRNKVVFGSGNARAQLVFVGEAPGYDEDIQGMPFVGKAGQLLTKIIEAIGLTRAEVFICNVLKCRPPQNRNPSPDEVVNCEPYLHRQLEIIKPKVICALGNFAAQTLLKQGKPISALRGRFLEYRGIPLMCTYHPAYLLRNPSDKRKVWEDMKMVRDKLKETN